MPTAALLLAPVRATPGSDGEQLTQLLAGEPVEVRESAGGWSRVVAPWQPSSLDPDGYPGWVRSADLGDDESVAAYPTPTPVGGEVLVEAAAALLGTPYVWGGMTADGIDCSGLVHVVARAVGLLVPRDAFDQAAALPPVGLDTVTTGDVYFFARPGRRVHHVGWVSAPARPGQPRRLLHAPDVGPARTVVEEALSPARLEHLVGAARVVAGAGS